jgi:hypothetical protein
MRMLSTVVSVPDLLLARSGVKGGSVDKAVEYILAQPDGE